MPPNFSLRENLHSLTNASSWKEILRSPPYEAFHNMDEAGWKEFLRKTNTTAAIGDTFSYGLQMIDDTRLLLKQTFFNGGQAANRQHLQFNFGVTDKPTDPDAAEFLDHFRQEKLQFNLDINRPDWGHVEMQCMNVPYNEHREGFGARDILSPAGEEFINCLTAQREKLLAIAGLAEEDHALFARILAEIEQAYRTEKLHPSYWSI